MREKTQEKLSGFSEKYGKGIALITGGTGSLGTALVRELLNTNLSEIRVYSRDEFKQSEMARIINNDRVKYWLGDVRDLVRLKEACDDVDVIIHTAALKRMDATSHNSYEVADVNIRGTKNVMLAANEWCADVIMVSTDKAFHPTCIYGASKMIAENIALADGAVVWRFGNFIGSRGSVWEVFKEQRDNNVPLTITDPNATRFILDIKDGVKNILSDVEPGLHYPQGLKSMTVMEIANLIAPGHPHVIVGLRDGEKLHESFNDGYTSKQDYV